MSAVRALFRNLEGYASEHNGEFPAIIELSEERYYDILNEAQSTFPGIEDTLVRESKIFGIPIKITGERIEVSRVSYESDIQNHFQAQFNGIQGSVTGRSLFVGYNSLAEHPIRPIVLRAPSYERYSLMGEGAEASFLSKDHPPYPLIGIEWEPQLTLLNYPKRMISVGGGPYMSKVRVDFISEDGFEDVCYLFLPGKYARYRDSDNLEFRTNPVKFEDLKKEIKRVQDEMENVVKEIAKEVGPTGIFLPGYPCTKHVNISGIECCDWHCGAKPGVFGLRYHAKVPYSFSNYEIMKTHAHDRDNVDAPIFLGYSMTGATYVRRSDLI